MVVIKVDTNTDSKENIRKSIDFLNKFLDSSVAESPNYDRVPSNAFNIFNNNDNPSEEPKSEINKESEDIEIKPIFY